MEEYRRTTERLFGGVLPQQSEKRLNFIKSN